MPSGMQNHRDNKLKHEFSKKAFLESDSLDQKNLHQNNGKRSIIMT